MRSVLLMLMISALAAGCGQKGALYFRESPPAGVKPPKPEPYQPLPYPKEPAEDENTGGDKK
jgi:predicted small lipoprotein YifL